MNRLTLIPLALSALALGACSHSHPHGAKHDMTRNAATRAAPMKMAANSNAYTRSGAAGDTHVYMSGDGCDGRNAHASGALVGNVTGGTRYECDRSQIAAAAPASSTTRTYSTSTTPTRTYSQPTYTSRPATRTYRQPTTTTTTTRPATRTYTQPSQPATRTYTQPSTTTRTYTTPQPSASTSRSTTYSYSEDSALSGAPVGTPAPRPTYSAQPPETLQTDQYTIRQTTPRTPPEGYKYEPAKPESPAYGN